MDYSQALTDPDEILEFLTPAIQDIDDALDSGISFADGIIGVPGRPFEPLTWSALVRYGACQRLDELQCEEWRRKPLGFCGIHVSRGGIELRVKKALADGPPHPGYSATLQAFYEQLPLFDGLAVTNLILDWQITADRQRILHLSKPIGSWRFLQRAKLEWRRCVELLNGASGLRFIGAEELDLDIAEVIEADELKEATGDEL